MALRLANSGREPLGQFDCVDSELASFKGGEVCSFAYVTTEGQPGVSQTGLDEAAYDVFDGYINITGTLKRPAVSKAWGTTLTTATAKPLFLSDDGVVGYGTLLGVVVGGTVGQTSYGPASTIPSSAIIGPSTALGSGKMTLWDKPGLYQVTLDAVDTSATGLVPTNTALTGGVALQFTSGGLLTPAGSAGALAIQVGHFVEFNTNGSLVTTPNYLVAALNSPSGIVSSLSARAFTVATIYFAPTS
jgi:hypothetical protein